jgi:hypothetical protein
MSRINSFLFLLILSAVVLSTGCKKDEEAGLMGTYSRSQQMGAETYLIELQFTNDGLLIWRPVDSIPGHTASTVKYEIIADGRFRIFDDPDCGYEGTFDYSANNAGLEVTVVSDDCNPREAAMSGYWNRK